MQDSGEDFETVHDTGAWARKVCAGIYDVNLAGLRSGNRVKTRESPEQFVIAACAGRYRIRKAPVR